MTLSSATRISRYLRNRLCERVPDFVGIMDSADHLVRPNENGVWNRQAQCFCGCSIDGELKPYGLFYREVGWSGPPDDFVDIRPAAKEDIDQTRSVGEQGSGPCKLPVRRDRLKTSLPR